MKTLAGSDGIELILMARRIEIIGGAMLYSLDEILHDVQLVRQHVQGTFIFAVKRADQR